MEGSSSPQEVAITVLLDQDPAKYFLAKIVKFNLHKNVQSFNKIAREMHLMLKVNINVYLKRKHTRSVGVDL